MESVVLIIHLVLALAIIGLVLLQRSEGGGLGIGGGGGGLGSFASARGTANALTKLTALCALGFFVTSLTLGILASRQSRQATGLLENMGTGVVEEAVPQDDILDIPEGIAYTPPGAQDGEPEAPALVKDLEKNIPDGLSGDAGTTTENGTIEDIPSAPAE